MQNDQSFWQHAGTVLLIHASELDANMLPGKPYMYICNDLYISQYLYSEAMHL